MKFMTYFQQKYSQNHQSIQNAQQIRLNPQQHNSLQNNKLQSLHSLRSQQLQNQYINNKKISISRLKHKKQVIYSSKLNSKIFTERQRKTQKALHNQLIINNSNSNNSNNSNNNNNNSNNTNNNNNNNNNTNNSLILQQHNKLNINNNKPIIYLSQKQLKKIKSQSFITMQLFPPSSSQIISGILYRKVNQIASLTKIMTFYTILTICKQYQILSSQYLIKIPHQIQQTPGTSAGLEENQIYTLEQLFYGLMLPSGNDASIVIASEGGKILKNYKNTQINNNEEDDVKCFVKYMNVIAKSIGMIDSNFANPHGLPNMNNYSSPYQLALLVKKCMEFQHFVKVINTKKYQIKVSCDNNNNKNINNNNNNNNKRQVKWTNTHKLLNRSGFIGGKTGVTITAGPCLATIYKSKTNQTFITILLRTSKLSRRFKQTRLILGYSLRTLDSIKYQNDYKQILKNNKVLDSDNSSQEEQFDFNKNDQGQLTKRSKILLYQL